jgi:hypothetical protein
MIIQSDYFNGVKLASALALGLALGLGLGLTQNLIDMIGLGRLAFPSLSLPG